MYQRNMCPAMGALRRTLAVDVSATSRSSTRAFSASARRCDESNNAAPAAPAAAKPDSRKARAANALNQITRLGANRRTGPGGLAKGSFPSGQRAAEPAHGPPRVRSEGGLKITRELVGPAGPSKGAPPPSAMARAPARLKLSRPPSSGPGGNTPVGGRRRGPNLRGRDGKQGGSSSGGNSNAERRPKKRDRTNDAEEGGSVDPRDVKIGDVLNDGMVQQLLRLQRSEWDRKSYEPKYAPGSFAANQLIHAGRELCRGEAPPVKIWGMLEKRIGVVGMHGAEAHLKVRRVVYDGKELGERREYSETGDVEVKGKAADKAKAKAKAPAVKAPAVKAAAAKAPAAIAQAAAASTPAPKQTAAVQ
ncbi:hypothetical protein SVAN01_05249 [Stagonosporopsis vannaccii]|nr:hypothetical protein SVAN01_05249 [Stagonosporopsis vannaccii]